MFLEVSPHHHHPAFLQAPTRAVLPVSCRYRSPNWSCLHSTCNPPPNNAWDPMPYSAPLSKYKEWPHLVVTTPSTDLTPQGKGCLATLLDPGSKWLCTSSGSLCHEVHLSSLWMDSLSNDQRTTDSSTLSSLTEREAGSKPNWLTSQGCGGSWQMPRETYGSLYSPLSSVINIKQTTTKTTCLFCLTAKTKNEGPVSLRFLQCSLEPTELIRGVRGHKAHRT